MTEVGEADSDEHADLPAGGRGRGSVLWLLPIFALAGLVALCALYAPRVTAASHADTVRAAALQAAKQEAVALTTIDYRTAASDVQRIIDGATGNLRQQFQSQQKQFPGVLATQKSQSRGVALSYGLQSLTGDKAVALAAVDATVSNTASAAAGTPSVVKHYRMNLTLQRIHGRWLVSDVAFAGLPQ